MKVANLERASRFLIDETSGMSPFYLELHAMEITQRLLLIAGGLEGQSIEVGKEWRCEVAAAQGCNPFEPHAKDNCGWLQVVLPERVDDSEEG